MSAAKITTTQPSTPFFAAIHSVRTQVLLIFLLGVALRAICFWQSRDNPLLYALVLDEEQHLETARQILANPQMGIPETFAMDPLYPYILAGIFHLVGDNLTVVRLIQILLDTSTLVALFMIGRRLWNHQVGLLAAIFYAIYPPAFFYPLTLLKTTLTTAFVTWMIFLMVFWWHRTSFWRWFVVGCLLGGGALLRGYLIFMPPAGVILLFLHSRDHGHRRRFAILGLILGTGWILALTGTKNLVTTGEFSILPLNSAIAFYSANYPGNPEGGYVSPPFVTTNHPKLLLEQYRREAEIQTGRTLNNKEAGAYWKNAVLTYWFASPEILPNLIIKKMGHLLSRTEIPNNRSIAVSAQFAPILAPAVPVFSLALALGLPGLILGIRQRPAALPLLIPIGMVVATGLIYYSSSRFRFPAVPMLLLGAAFLLTKVWFNKERCTKTILATAVIATLLLTVSMANHGPSGGNQENLNLAFAYGRLRAYDKAHAILDRLAEQPGQLPKWKIQRIASYVFLREGNYLQAFQHGIAALSQAGSDPILLHNVGLAALNISGYEAIAVSLLAQALKIQPDAETQKQLNVAKMLANLRMQNPAPKGP